MLRNRGIHVLVFALAAGLMLTGCADSDTVQAEKQGRENFVYREIKTTYTYKQVGDLKIKADVLQVHDNVARPVVVWIHGGALMTGGRDAVPLKIQRDLFALGYDIITIDYRLAPETKLPEIIADLEDFFKWLYKVGPSELGIDTSESCLAPLAFGSYCWIQGQSRAHGHSQPIRLRRSDRPLAGGTQYTSPPQSAPGQDVGGGFLGRPPTASRLQQRAAGQEHLDLF